MKAPLIVDALRARDPGAPAAMYDTHGESLFRYCWFILRNRDAAQVALRDSLVVAEAHIGQLNSPGLLRPWLYALARAECRRRQQSHGSSHDTVIARPDQPDADRRLLAWHAVMSLTPEEREALELTIRHDMDPPTAALVMGLPPDDVVGILAEGRAHLEQALAGEILARHGVHGCRERAEALRGWAGELTVPLRERLVRHAGSCEVCGRYLPRNVSATKVFSLLPAPAPPQPMRLRLMTCFSDPELVGYRMFVAARVTDFNQLGFPAEEAVAPPPQPRVSVRSVWSGPAAAAVAVAVLAVAVFGISRMGGFGTAVRGASSSVNGATVQPAPTATRRPGGSGPASRRAPLPRARGDRATVAGLAAGSGHPTRLVSRDGTPGARPASGGHSDPEPSPSPGHLQVSPGTLDVGAGSTGQITLTASGGSVDWSAVTSTPDITLSSGGGTIGAGQQVTLTVDITRVQHAAGQGTITFGSGGSGGSGDQTVTVSWSDPPSSPPPSPTGSATPTVVPSSVPPPSGPGPSPTPTQSPGPPVTSSGGPAAPPRS